jgi:hypothetical protein
VKGGKQPVDRAFAYSRAAGYVTQAQRSSGLGQQADDVQSPVQNFYAAAFRRACFLHVSTRPDAMYRLKLRIAALLCLFNIALKLAGIVRLPHQIPN